MVLLVIDFGPTASRRDGPSYARCAWPVRGAERRLIRPVCEDGQRRRSIAATNDQGSSMTTYSMACADVMPGCDATFSEDSKATLMEQIVGHAAAVHGITEITPEVATAVGASIKES